MASRVRLAPLALILLSSLAWPNGGPVAWNEPAGAGDGSPLAQSSVALVSEDLKITVGASPDVYDVEASYILSNPGAATTVRYGVPITWGLMEEGEAAAAALQRAAAGVSIELGGVKQGCKLQKSEGSPLIIGIPEQLQVENLAVGAWCVTDLKIPVGKSVPLTLRYRANASYVDGETSKSALPSWASRDIVYPLFPAAGWAGRPSLKVRIELGPWADDSKVLHPAGFKRAGTAWTYTSAGADLAGIGAIVARLDVDSAKQAALISTWNAEPSQWKVPLVATASSTLAGGSYGAGNLVDGRADTAWCEGVEGDGVGQWFELRAAPGTKLSQHCHLQGLAFVPGYAKSQPVFENNNRVRSVALSACGSDQSFSADLGGERRFDRASGIISLDEGGIGGVRGGIVEGFIKDPSSLCVRLTVTAVDRGAKFQDTCVSEAVALVNCG